VQPPGRGKSYYFLYSRTVNWLTELPHGGKYSSSTWLHGFNRKGILVEVVQMKDANMASVDGNDELNGRVVFLHFFVLRDSHCYE